MWQMKNPDSLEAGGKYIVVRLLHLGLPLAGQHQKQEGISVKPLGHQEISV